MLPLKGKADSLRHGILASGLSTSFLLALKPECSLLLSSVETWNPQTELE
jgi:hypothetical protein